MKSKKLFESTESCVRLSESELSAVKSKVFLNEHQEDELESLLASLTHELKASLDSFFDEVDISSIAKLAYHIKASSGTLFLSGVGKSGIIARKIATTISSTGTRALYLSPLDALHGDLGTVFPKDIIIAFSKSGETEELLHLCPALRNKGAEIVAVVSNQRSRLAKAADHVIYLPLARELCPFDISPTTSTVEQLIFGDLLAMALMRSKKISLEDFILNHPGGRIGRRQLIKVRDIMLTGSCVPRASKNNLLMESLVDLSNKQCGCLLIVDEEDMIEGIFTDGDLRRAIQKHGMKALELTLEELMTKTPRCISPDALARDALEMMEADQKRPITVLAVVDSGKLSGLIKMHDILQSGL